jgi:hypothetical protein
MSARDVVPCEQRPDAGGSPVARAAVFVAALVGSWSVVGGLVAVAVGVLA